MSNETEYEPPRLVMYGDIEELTEKTGKRKTDGKNGSNKNKTPRN